MWVHILSGTVIFGLTIAMCLFGMYTQGYKINSKFHDVFGFILFVTIAVPAVLGWLAYWVR